MKSTIQMRKCNAMYITLTNSENETITNDSRIHTPMQHNTKPKQCMHIEKQNSSFIYFFIICSPKASSNS